LWKRLGSCAQAQLLGSMNGSCKRNTLLLHVQSLCNFGKSMLGDSAGNLARL